MFQYFGILSGLLSAVSYIPYLRDIFRRSTKPERASWLIWSVLGSIAFFSQLAEGATWSLWLPALDTLGVVLIFVLSIKYGTGGLARRDVIALAVAFIGLVIWFLTSQPVLALLITIFIDITGAYLTVIKAFEDPGSETMSTWLLIAFAGILSALAVGEVNLTLLIYPLYIFLANFAVVVAIQVGKLKKRKRKV